jgi:hypothetical protein
MLQVASPKATSRVSAMQVSLTLARRFGEGAGTRIHTITRQREVEYSQESDYSSIHGEGLMYLVLERRFESMRVRTRKKQRSTDDICNAVLT